MGFSGFFLDFFRIFRDFWDIFGISRFSGFNFHEFMTQEQRKEEKLNINFEFSTRLFGKSGLLLFSSLGTLRLLGQF